MDSWFVLPARLKQLCSMSTERSDSQRAPEPVGLYPHARKVGNLLFLSGVGPRERGTKKYTQRGEQAALHKLQNDSQGDEATAVQMIHQSIANGWQGIFPLKNQKNETKRSGPSDGSLLAEHLRRLAADSGESLE